MSKELARQMLGMLDQIEDTSVRLGIYYEDTPGKGENEEGFPVGDFVDITPALIAEKLSALLAK